MSCRGLCPLVVVGMNHSFGSLQFSLPCILITILNILPCNQLNYDSIVFLQNLKNTVFLLHLQLVKPKSIKNLLDY